MINSFINLIRLKHWIKNLFVLIPIFITGNFFNIELLYYSLVMFFSFSFTSSAVYIINDILDIEFDKLHPVKKYRPLPSGKISKQSALGILFIFLVLACFCLSLVNYIGFVPVLAYFIINILYSYSIKNIPILDISSISCGFVLRVYAGLEVTSLEGSFWLFSLTFVLSMLLATGKRKQEFLIDKNSSSRPSLAKYNYEFLVASQVIFSTCVICFYTLYTFFNENFSGNQSMLMFSSVLVLLGILRYLQIDFSKESIDEPTDILYKDRFMLTIVVLWALLIFLAF
jgi:decaprenyl-phosphate phosphoribosyltransferase